MLLSAASPERIQRFALQFISRDNENAIRSGIGNVNDPKIAAAARVPDRDAGTFTAGPVFNGPLENLRHFGFRDVVQANVRLSGFGIDIEAQFHSRNDITGSGGLSARSCSRVVFPFDRTPGIGGRVTTSWSGPVVLPTKCPNIGKKLFLSAVSREFLAYRQLLAQDLKRPALDVAVQEDFIVTGASTLEKLDDYIRACDGMVHLIGKAAGALPEEPAVAALAPLSWLLRGVAEGGECQGLPRPHLAGHR